MLYYNKIQNINKCITYIHICMLSYKLQVCYFECGYYVVARNRLLCLFAPFTIVIIAIIIIMFMNELISSNFVMKCQNLIDTCNCNLNEEEEDQPGSCVDDSNCQSPSQYN